MSRLYIPNKLTIIPKNIPKSNRKLIIEKYKIQSIKIYDKGTKAVAVSE